MAEVAQRLQQRFEYYAIALTFSILALAIQSASPGPIGTIPELLAWISLLISGLVGLSRLEWQPMLYELHSLQSAEEKRERELKNLELQGVQDVYALDIGGQVRVTSVLANVRGGLSLVADRIAYVKKRSRIKYEIQRWTFAIGVIALVVARVIDLIFEVTP